ncbi:tail completion protein gp17 [Tautonia plasticadhaerens]|uniref:DUF3168 domain-containing protein n=1 Tax=Tautonia plasticadhaerens TaxID=2527974 RepID=A0A518GZK0_9BACT|nr:DUF3168 domain-containing protein [Tautonia plasticadhaerens]QDV34015.1 hypothetical protein ElP_18960 [Tautonia plasticadhaerens]
MTLAELIEAVRARTAADAAVAARAASRVYPGWIPQGASTPAVTFTVIGHARGRHLDGAGDWGRARVQFDCWADDPADAAALAAALADLWHGHRGGSLSARQLDEQDLPEPPAGGGGAWSGRISLDFSFLHR